jgi:hypothetical protein
VAGQAHGGGARAGAGQRSAAAGPPRPGLSAGAVRAAPGCRRRRLAGWSR